MNRTKLVLSSAAAALLVAVAVAPAALGALRATPTPNNGPSVTTLTGHGGEHGQGHHRECYYPPQRTPDLSLTGPAHVRRNVDFSLQGRISVHDCGLSGRTVGLYAPGGKKGVFKLVDSARSDSNGNVSFSTHIKVTTDFVAISASGGGYTTAVSNVVTVRVTR